MIMMIPKVQDEKKKRLIGKKLIPCVCGDMFDVDDPQIENASQNLEIWHVHHVIQRLEINIGAVSTGTSVKF